LKDTVFCQKKTLNIRGKLVDTGKPMVMGVLNVTPDSFYPGSRIGDEQELLNRAEAMIREGADILDIGGYSSRPDAIGIPEEEELSRVIPAVNAIQRHFSDTFISVDTFRSGVAIEAVRSGASLINDISGGQIDPQMFDVAAACRVPYILMHMRGDPATMKNLTAYDDLLEDLLSYFIERIGRLHSAGVSDIVIDPGFGFAKTAGQNFNILRNLNYFQILGLPLMTGISRKSLIYKTLNIKPEEALNGTTVLHALTLLKGVSLLRVHDVKAAREAVTLVNHYLS
jgi:dihydropteroate synthase